MGGRSGVWGVAKFPLTLARNAIPLGGAFLMAPGFFVIATANKALFTLFSPRLAAAIDRILYSGYMSYVTLYYELVSQTELVFHGEADPLLAQDDAVLYISNHQCTMDWVVANWVANRQSIDALSRTQYVMKSAVSLAPCYGLYLYLHGGAFVRKNRERDAATLRHAVDWYHEVGARPWIILYPEGTRIQPDDAEKMRHSQDHCERHGYPRFEHVLAPRVRGFRALAAEMLACYGDRASVCDVTIAYGGPICQGRASTPSMVTFLSGDCPQIDVRVTRIPLADIPLHSEEETRNWLYLRYLEKNDWLDQAYRGPGDNKCDVASTAAPAVTNSPSTPQNPIRPPFYGLFARSTITLAICLAPYAILGRKRAFSLAALLSVTSSLLSRMICYR